LAPTYLDSGFEDLAILDKPTKLRAACHQIHSTVHTNGNYFINHLQRVLQMANAAHETNALHPRGMRVGISECWLKKVSVAEEVMNTVTGNTINGRNVYSCFASLNREFHLCMVKAGYYERMDFIEPFWSEYYFIYLDYDQMQPYVQSLALQGDTADQIGVALQNTNQALVFPALAAGQQTAAAQGYAEYIEPGSPTLWITNNGTSSVSLGWSPVALNFLLEHKSHLANSSSNWTSIPILPRAIGNDFRASMVTTNARDFYRLHQPRQNLSSGLEMNGIP
jgi:hypothetical protein